MYSSKIIEANCEAFAAKEGWLPQRHSLGEVLDFNENLNKILRFESNSKFSWPILTRNISENYRKKIKQWVENEQVMCALDSDYWQTRYAYVVDEGGNLKKFQNRKSQEVFDQIIAQFDERQVSIQILCLDPDTRVLTADLRWVRIDDLKAGDEVVSVDEGQTAEARKKMIEDRVRERKQGIKREKLKKHVNRERKMRTAVVEEKWDTFQPAIRLTFDDGRTLITTPEHRLLSRQRGGYDPIWKQTKSLKVGDQIRYITHPWEESSYEDGWFGGFIDGEGCMSGVDDSGVDITVTQRFNIAYERARKYLEDRGYAFRLDIDERTSADSSVFGNSSVARLVVGRSNELFRLLGQTRPIRFINRRWWEGRTLPGKKTGVGWAKIVSIELLPKRRMVDIQTSTRTFIAEGFVSHNCLKGRQVGITTKVALIFIHRMLFIPNTLAVMASVQAEKSKEIEVKLNSAYKGCPFWLVPAWRSKKELHNGSRLNIESGMQPKGIAQGKTPNCIHISEITLIPNPKNVIEEGLLPATHSNKNLFMVFEGTGSGNVGWFPDFWRDQKKSFPTGDARMCPIFIPWPMATDLYPQADWIREHPVPVGFYERREEATKKHVARCESFIRNTDYLARVAGSNYRMPLEQQWFWQFEYRQARERHTLQQHAARMPADDFEALTGVHDTVFDPEVISEVEENVYEVITDRVTGADIKQRKEPVMSYAIIGHSIDYKFDPDEGTVDESKPIIDIAWTNNRNERYDWQMVPLLPFNEENEIETMDRLLIFEEPQRGFEYSLGIDTAHGLGKPDEERFCGSMSKVGRGGGYDTQVCEYTSNRLSPSQAVPFMACVAAYYGQKSGNPRGVKFTIEQVEGPGDTCQNQLKIMGFNWHYTPGRLDGRKVKDENRHREGFYSNKTTVPILMDRFVEAFNGGWYRPKSKYLIEECKSLERHMVSGGRDKMEHQKGKFDDRIRAAAMSYLSSHTYDDLTARSQKRYAVPNSKRKNPNEGRCMLNSISVGDLD